MRRVALLLAWLLALSACGDGASNSFTPPGSYAGSTAADQAITLDVSDKVRINRREGRFVQRGVIEVKDGGAVTTLSCKVVDNKGEELRCTLRVTPNQSGAPTTEVLDLMRL